MILQQIVPSWSVRFSEIDGGMEVGHAYLCIIMNDRGYYGLLEDLAVHPAFRRCGIATRLHEAVVRAAKQYVCYKLLATSRTDGTRDAVHAWYVRLGYRVHGAEFRMDL